MLEVTKQATIQELRSMQGVAKAQKPPALAKYMEALWNSMTLDCQVPSADFLLGLEEWMVDNG